MKYVVSFALVTLLAALLILRSGEESVTVAGSALEQVSVAAVEEPLGLAAAESPAGGGLPVVTVESADVDEAGVTWSASQAVKLSSFGLFKIEVECDTVTGEPHCRPVPGTLPFDHPYWTYPVESLEAMPGDAVANHVLGIRLAQQNPDAGFGYIVRAVGLSGKPGSLVDFYNQGGWNRTAVNGEPDIESMKKAQVVLDAAERLGHTMSGAEEARRTLEPLITPSEMAEINAAADAVVREVRSIDVTVEYQS